MIELEQLKEKLKENNIKIKEEIDEGINVLYLNKIPETVEIINTERRRPSYKWNFFIIKSCDLKNLDNNFYLMKN